MHISHAFTFHFPPQQHSRLRRRVVIISLASQRPSSQHKTTFYESGNAFSPFFWNEENGSILHPVFLRFSLRFNNTRELWRIGGNCTQKTKCLDSFTSSEAEDAKASPRLSWLDVFPRKTCANLDSFARARVFGLCSEEQTLYGLQLNSRQENSEFACFQRFSHWGPFQHEILLPFWHSLYPP